jgi:tRNA pseudouridine13 synthase
MSVPAEDATGILSLALSPPRAGGEPPARGRLRSVPEDFVVEEDLGFEPDGAGAHILLHVRKRGANTEWVARELARQGGSRPADVGYAGLKDRHGVALQWFSVPAGRRALGDWVGAQGEGYEVLAAHAHRRKLPRGALAGNRFRIRVRELAADRGALAARLEAIASRGVPNYFGEQRFGRGGGNLRWLEQPAAGLPAGAKRHERSLMLSSARSVIFNALLARRVLDGSWERLEVGDVAILDGRGSVFGVSELTPQLIERCQRLEIHPTGPLWGRGEPPSAGGALERERLVAAQLAGACAAVTVQGMRQERRSLRLSVRELQWHCVAEELEVEFRLSRGSFATVVLRELLA